MFALQCCELLAKGQVFKEESATIAEESQDRTYKELNDIYHASLLSHSACGQQLCILLKSQADRILANDSQKLVEELENTESDSSRTEFLRITG